MLEVEIKRNENNGKEYCSNAAELVAVARDKWDLSPKEIAEICGCDPSTVSGWVSKKGGAPKLLQRLVNHLIKDEIEEVENAKLFNPSAAQILDDHAVERIFDLCKQGKTLEEAKAIFSKEGGFGGQ